MAKEWKPNPDPMFDDFGGYIAWKAEQEKKSGLAKKKKASTLRRNAALPDEIIKRTVKK